MRGTATERFDAKVLKRPDGCWEWIAGRDRWGYGKFRGPEGKTVLAHVFSYERSRGKVPKGKELDHLCRREWCVNPDHLEPVAHVVNCRRGNAGKANNANRAKARCPKGHAYSPENTYTDPKGIRHCRECGRAVMRRLYRERKAA